MLKEFLQFGLFSVNTVQTCFSHEFFFMFFVSFGSFLAYGNLGSVLSTKGRYNEAKESLQLALKHRPNMADVHYNL